MNPGMSRHADELILAAEKLLICENRQCRSTILLIGERYLLCLAFLFDPSFGGRASLELSDDTCL